MDVNGCQWEHPFYQWISLRENLNRKPMGFYNQIDRVFRLKFSHHQWEWMSMIPAPGVGQHSSSPSQACHGNPAEPVWANDEAVM